MPASSVYRLDPYYSSSGKVTVQHHPLPALQDPAHDVQGGGSSLPVHDSSKPIASSQNTHPALNTHSEPPKSSPPQSQPRMAFDVVLGIEKKEVAPALPSFRRSTQSAPKSPQSSITPSTQDVAKCVAKSQEGQYSLGPVNPLQEIRTDHLAVMRGAEFTCQTIMSGERHFRSSSARDDCIRLLEAMAATLPGLKFEQLIEASASGRDYQFGLLAVGEHEHWRQMLNFIVDISKQSGLDVNQCFYRESTIHHSYGFGCGETTLEQDGWFGLRFTQQPHRRDPGKSRVKAMEFGWFQSGADGEPLLSWRRTDGQPAVLLYPSHEREDTSSAGSSTESSSDRFEDRFVKLVATFEPRGCHA